MTVSDWVIILITVYNTVDDVMSPDEGLPVTPPGYFALTDEIYGPHLDKNS